MLSSTSPKLKPPKISKTVLRWLIICVVIAFLASTVFLWVSQTRLARANAVKLLTLNITDVKNDIDDASDENLLALTHVIAGEVSGAADPDPEYLKKLAREHSIAEISLINDRGFITVSTYDDFKGYNMADGEQSAEFLVLLDGQSEFVQSYQPISYDASMLRKYAGVTLPGGGFVQVGYDSEQFQKDIAAQVIGVTRNRHVGENGSVIIADENWRIVSARRGNEGKNLSVTDIWIDRDTIPEGQWFYTPFYGEECYCMYVLSEGYYIIAVMPRSEAVVSRNASVGVTSVMEVVVFTALFLLIYYLMRKLVVENIEKINGSLSRITGGDLDVTVDVRSNEEFASLSDDINMTVHTLKRYISEAEARIDAELAFAKAIQLSALPSVFPPFPNRAEFDIWALMDTAKEVGGDFYDFYFVSENTLAFLVADVSGKGIPAAMFMMTSKTIMKDYAEGGKAVNDVFACANQKLCDGNETGMFVTAWMGTLDLKTGLVTFANAGHNPPLVRHGDGEFEYLRTRPGFVLAGMEGSRYKPGQLTLLPGDEIFLYTDGVTEATDKDNQLYGDDRLLAVLNRADARGLDAEALCRLAKADVDAFVGAAPQFDDITMLCLRIKGQAQ